MFAHHALSVAPPHAAYALAQLFRGRGCHRRTAAPHRTAPQTAFCETLQNFLAIDNVLVTAGILFTSRVQSPVSYSSGRSGSPAPPRPILQPYLTRTCILSVCNNYKFVLTIYWVENNEWIRYFTVLEKQYSAHNTGVTEMNLYSEIYYFTIYNK